MIIKGASRAGPEQLARHLLRADTNERVEIVELHSPIGDLHGAFADWQLLASATRGTKGLYHANIDPAKGYEMTREQWLRSVEVLEKELGFDGQPRAIVLHQKQGREHIHVVWQRTDIDEMKLLPDSYNYLAHERASARLEREFGHEMVPGKHAKRDRQKQPEFPAAEYTHAEWQQMERTGVDPRERKARIKSLYEASDSPEAFKAAVEHDGYLLAKGDRRDFVLVDSHSQVHSLSRQIKGVTAKDLREFMAGIDRESLPTVDDACDLQKQLAAERDRQEEVARHERAAREQAERDAAERKDREGAEALERDSDNDEKKRKAAALTAEERARFEKLLAERQAADLKRLHDAQDAEARKAQGVLDNAVREKMDRFDALQAEARNSFLREHKDQKARDDMAARLKAARMEYFAIARQERNKDIDRLLEEQARQAQAERLRQEKECEHYRKDEDAARRLLEDLERTRQREEEERGRARDGPGLPPTR